MRAHKLVVSLGAVAALIAGAAVTASSCLLTDFEVGAPLVDAGMDVVTQDAAMEAGPPHCGKTYPDPPSGADMPISNTIVVAIHSIDLGEGEANPPGYDLDAKCTCFEDAGPTCVSASGNQHCDAPDGVDSAAAQLINLITTAVGVDKFGSTFFSTQADQGHWSMLVQVTNYNGLMDDPSVNVAIFPSKGLSAMTPTWDGSDAWPVDATSVVGGDLTKPVYTSAGAYVSGGVLVAAMPAMQLHISGAINTITIRLSEGVITGTLSQIGQNWRITDGVIAARWHEPDIFAAFSSYRDSNGKPLCTDLGFVYATAKSAICSGLDILEDQGGAKSLPCDSLSMGIGFHADPAKIGVVAPPPTPAPGCPVATDPINDSCSK